MNIQDNPRNILIYFALKYGGDWERCFLAIRNREAIDNDEYYELLSSNNGNIITILDPEFPECLRHIYRPPLVLFYHGDISLLSNKDKNVGYVGSREASSYGLMAARNICKDLADYGYNIISGLAYGIDTAAILGALEAKGKVVAVLGNGIDYCYPSENTPIYKKLCYEGLVISEYPGMTEPTKETFPFRNRIIAALSKGLVVGEASKRSGTLITVNYALSNNVEIGCVPFRLDEYSACNALIKEGAFMIENANDVLLMIGDQRGEKEYKNFT